MPCRGTFVKFKTIRIIHLVSLFVLFGLSCNILQVLSSGPEPSETQGMDPTNFVVATAVPSLVPSVPCPVPAISPPATIGAESFDIVSSITDYLNAGGNLDELENKIEELALLIQETPPIIEVDLDGDGFIDLVVSVLLPSGEVYPLSGQSHIYLCREATYELIYSTPQETQIGLPRFYSIKDVTGDGLKREILILL